MRGGSSKTRIETRWGAFWGNAAWGVWEEVPVKQGLKQYAGLTWMWPIEGMRGGSSKTRIETARAYLAELIMKYVWEEVPVKQGLKQQLAVIGYAKNMSMRGGSSKTRIETLILKYPTFYILNQENKF